MKPIAVFLLLALFLVSGIAAGLSSPAPDAAAGCRGEPCLTFPHPVFVLCNMEGTPFLDEMAIGICRYVDPARWILTSTTGMRTVLIGVDCFTAYHDVEIP